MPEFKFDEIGYWSEVKLDILRRYASAYSTVLAKQSGLKHLYIDGFAGAGVHISRLTGDYVLGGPLNALLVKPPFAEYHLIDLNRRKAAHLQRLVDPERLGSDVFVYAGDCNRVLLDVVFQRARYEDYRRALCVLDPYGLHLDWDVIQTAGGMKSVDLFVNFPVMDINMNVLWRDPDRVDPGQAARLTRFWGDESWRAAAYTTGGNLFGYDEKTSNEDVAAAFRDRLRSVAKFRNVIEPIPMRNDHGAVVYYLYFMSQNATGNKIAGAIFDKYRNWSTSHG